MHLYEKLTPVLSVPENRIKYCYQFMNTTHEQMRALAFQRACEFIAVCDESESHY
jgi:hypothetical protein